MALITAPGASLTPSITGGITAGQQVIRNQQLIDAERQRQQLMQQQQMQAQQAQQQAQQFLQKTQQGQPVRTTPEFAQFMISNPEVAERLNNAIGARTDAQKEMFADIGLDLIQAEGNPELQQGIISRGIQSLQQAGANPEVLASLANAGPERVSQGARAMVLSQLSPKELASIAGQGKGAQVQKSEFIPGEGFAALTESGEVMFRALPDDLKQRLRQQKIEEQQAKLTALEEGPVKLSAHLEKRLTQSVDDAAQAQASANSLDALAGQFEQERPTGGFRGSAIEALKDFTGNQDAVSLMRKKFAGIRASQAVKNLPPGAASDKDIELALSGFPPPNANADFIASWLRGVSKLERERANFEDFRSAFISAGGSPDRAKKGFEFDGFEVEKGDRLTNAYRQYRLGQGDSAVVIKDHPRFGNITEEDIQETLRQNPGLTRDAVIFQFREQQ